MSTYPTSNPLARTSPLRSMPQFRSAASVLGPTPRWAAETMLATALDGVARMEEGYRDACRYLGVANAAPKLRRRACKAGAFRAINVMRARLRTAQRVLAEAQARVATLVPADDYATPYLAAQAALAGSCRVVQP